MKFKHKYRNAPLSYKQGRGHNVSCLRTPPKYMILATSLRSAYGLAKLSSVFSSLFRAYPLSLSVYEKGRGLLGSMVAALLGCREGTANSWGPWPAFAPGLGNMGFEVGG